jgi:hypothetical protein
VTLKRLPNTAINKQKTHNLIHEDDNLLALLIALKVGKFNLHFITSQLTMLQILNLAHITVGPKVVKSIKTPYFENGSVEFDKNWRES